MFGVQSFYVIFFVFFALYALVLNKSIKSREKFFLWCFTIFFLLGGLRGETVGGDLKRYLPAFDVVASTAVGKLFEVSHHEPGYLFFEKFLSIFSDEPRFFLLITSFVSLIGPFYMFYRHSKNPVVSILLYYAMGYYTNTFNNVRQSIALSIAFAIMPFLIERKLIKYLIGALFATSFHYSAIVLFVAYPLTSSVLNKKRLLIYTISTTAFVALFTLDVFSYVATYALSKYDPEELLEERSGSGYGLLAFYASIFILLALFYFSKKRGLDSKQCRLLSTIVVFQLLTMAIQMCAPMFASMIRMTFYFFIPVVTIGIPYIHSIIRNKIHREYLYFATFAFAIVYMIFIIYALNPESGSNGQGVIPYVFLETTIF